MATSASPQSQQHGLDDRSQVNDQVSQPRIEDGGYHETTTTEIIATKTGAEDGTIFRSERPVSAGSASGTDYEYDRYSDNTEDIVAACTAYTGVQSVKDTNSASVGTGNFLTKSETTDRVDASEGFRYGPASHQPVRFEAAPQRLTSALDPPPQPMREFATDRGIAEAEQMEGDVAAQTSDQHAALIVETNEAQAGQASTLLKPEGGVWKRRKKSAKSKPHHQLLERSEARVVDRANMAGEAQPSVDMAGYPSHPERESQPNIDSLEQTRGTQDHSVIQNEPQQPEGSPHDQLQNDLDVATDAEPAHVTVFSHPSTQTLQGNEDVNPQPYREAAECSNAVQPSIQSQGQEQRLDRQAGISDANPTAASKVQKRKQKMSCKSTTTSQTKPANAHNWTLADYAKLFALKVEEEKQAQDTSFFAERQALQSEIQEAIQSKTAFQSSLEDAMEQNQELSVKCNKQQEKLTSYGTKFKNLKGFVDGLGRDIDSLKKDANTLRRKSDDIIAEAEIRSTRDTRVTEWWDGLYDAGQKCKNATQNALNLAQEKEKELHQITLHRDQLQRDINDTVGMLSEQRDRCAKLEIQVKNSEQQLLKTVKANQEIMLDKLHLIHAAVEDEQSKKDTAQVIDQLRSASEALGSPAEPTLQEIADVKSIVESLDQRLNHNMKAVDAAGANTRAHFDEGLKTVLSQLADREKLCSNHDDVVRNLQEQLSATNSRITDEAAQKSTAQQQVSELRNQNTMLQTKISGLQSKIPPVENAQMQLSEAKIELEKTSGALSSTKADLNAKIEELRALTVANTNLEGQLKAVQDQLRDLQNDNGHSTSTRDFESKVKKAEQQIREEMAANFGNYETQLKTKANNDLKKLNSEKSRLEKQIKPMQDEIASYRHQISQIQLEKPGTTEALKQELERTKQHNQSQRNKIDTLQCSINNLKTSSRDGKALQEKLSTMTAQVNAEKSKLRDTCERNAGLHQQVKQLEGARVEIQLDKEQAAEQLIRLRLESEKEKAALEKDLEDAKDDAELCKADLDTFKQSFDDAVSDANKEYDRRLQTVQQQLSDKQEELENSKKEHKAFHEGVDQAFKKEQSGWDQKIAEAARRISELEAQRADTQASYEVLLEQLREEMKEQRVSIQEENDELRERLQAAEKKLQAQQLSSGQSKAIQVPLLKHGITPSASARSGPPTGPRKKINRDRSETTEVGPILAPEELRPDSRKLISANVQAVTEDATKGPVVEESQFVSDPFNPQQTQAQRLDRTQVSFSIFSDNQDFTALDDMSQPGSQMIPETQREDSLPSFAALNSGPAIQTETYEEARGELLQDQSTQASGRQRRKQSRSQDDIDDLISRQPIPRSNSAVKRVPSDHMSANPKPQGSQRRGSTDRYKTPVLNTETAVNGNSNRIPSGTSSSPPAWMGTKPHRDKSYGTPGKLGRKQPADESHPGQIEYPRRRQETGTKRKASGQNVEGYEEERKKRLAMNAKATDAIDRRSRPQHVQSIDGLPTRKTTRTSSKTHMQTFAGGTSRTTRPMRKAPRSDEINARFAQELKRR